MDGAKLWHVPFFFVMVAYLKAKEWFSRKPTKREDA